MTLDSPGYLRDPRYVRDQYASERGLVDRVSLYENTTGPFAGDVAFRIVAEAAPRRVLEVGCGTGWFASRLARELGIEVVALDQSERMVELTRAEGVDARVGDVQDLPFGDEEFDCVAAHWMLYHVPDLDGALAEIARALTPGGRLVAITNRKDHLFELWELVGAGDARLVREFGFGAENGEEILRRHFREVELHEADGTVEIGSREAIVRYLDSSDAWRPLLDRLPEQLALPVTARRSNVVFVATK